MRGILADVNVERHLQILVGLFNSDSRRELCLPWICVHSRFLISDLIRRSPTASCGFIANNPS